MKARLPARPCRTRLSAVFVLAASLVAVWLLVGAGSAGAATSVHCDTNSAALQPAINSAGSGDTLSVYGTCKGQFTINKNLTLQAGAPGATLDGQAGGTTLTSPAEGFCESCGFTLSIDGLKITNGSGDDGGGIGFKNGTLTLTNSTVSGNSALVNSLSDGGGIYTQEASVTVSNSTVSGNSGYTGGGIYADGTALTITGSTFSGNSATGVGGGIYTESSTTANVIGSKVNGNSTGPNREGGGIYVDFGSTVNVTNSTVSNNSASFGGGAYQNGTLTLTGAIVSGNKATGDGGGTFTAVAALTVTNSTISQNTAGATGGGMYADVADISLSGSTVSGNTSGYKGGGIVTFGQLSSGLSLTNSTVTKNISRSGYGGGIASDTNDNNSPVTIQNSTIANNRELNGPGGGIANVGNSGDTATLTITSSTLAGNTASGMGGAIYNTVSDSSSGAMATVSVGQSSIGPRPNFLNDGNKAQYGGGIANDGANGPASVSLQSGTSVFSNWASVDGGGVFNTNGGSLLIGPGATVFLNHPDNVS